jgi:hypothetical protein
VINADPDAWYHSDGMREQMGEQAWEDYQRAIHDPATVRAMSEDYRAGLGMDRQHDNADLAARHERIRGAARTPTPRTRLSGRRRRRARWPSR